MDINKCGMYIAQLMSCAITGQKPDAIPEGVTPEDIASLSMSHRICNIVYAALSSRGELQEDAAWIKLREIADFGVMFEAQQQYYLDLVSDALEAAKIHYTVMKGSVIKSLYPSPELRQSADIDILIDRRDAERIKEIMTNEGFTCTAFGDNGTSDDYTIDKTIHFEFHRRLIKNSYRWTEACNEIPSRLVSGDGYALKMTDEDYYIFMLCHVAKHMKFGGIGLKAILDIWVYLREYKNLDMDFINAELEKCGLCEFHDNMLQLCGYWFEGKPADKLIQAMSSYIFASGWNGVAEQWSATDLAEMTEKHMSKRSALMKQLCSMIFWPRERMAVKYPILNRLPFLLPFCWVHRAVKASFTKRDMVTSTVESFDRADEEQSRKINEFRTAMGL